jgi:hypothetical protein
MRGGGMKGKGMRMGRKEGKAEGGGGGKKGKGMRRGGRKEGKRNEEEEERMEKE